MNYRRVISVLLLAFVIFSVLYLILLKSNSATVGLTQGETANLAFQVEGADSAQPVVTETSEITVVYYFHRTARCATCRALESKARDAIFKNFSEELERGSISFRTVNVDEPGNRKFIERYQITGPALVVSYAQDGEEVRWKNLDRIWELIRKPGEYSSYIANGIRGIMDSES